MEYKIPKALQALTSLPTENEVLPAAFSNVFGVIVLIIPNCYNLPMFPVIPRMLQVTTLVYMLYGAKASYFKSMIPIVDSPVRKSVVERKCYCGSKSSSKPICTNNMRYMCFKNYRYCTNVSRCGECGNKWPASEDKEKRQKRIRHKLVLAVIQVGENQLQLIKPPSKINSFQHCILEPLFFFIIKDSKILLLVVKDFLFIVEILQQNYDIIVEDIEGEIGICLKWLQRKIQLIAQFRVQ